MTGTIWDQVNTGGGDGFKFVAEGDVIEGVLEDTRVVTFEAKGDQPERKVVELTLDGTTVLCGPVDLKRKLSDLRPELGDRVRIKLISLVANKHGGKSKIFDVTVTKAVAANSESQAPF